MPDNDKAFKELLGSLFKEFVDLMLPKLGEYLDANTMQLLDKELFVNVTAGETHEADLVIKAKYKEQDAFFLVHIEAQAHYQATFSRRMFNYFARLYEKYGLPVYPIAVFSYNSDRRIEPTEHVVEFPDLKVLQFTYQTVQLSRLNWRDFANNPNPVAIALMTTMRIHPKDRAKVKLECLRLLATLKIDPAKMELISKFIYTYLKLTAKQEREFQQQMAQIASQEKEKVMELLHGWREEGIEQGVKKTVLKSLCYKFGQLGKQTLANINKLNTEQLESLMIKVLSSQQLTEIDTWIRQQLASSVGTTSKANGNKKPKTT
jgi:Domain of unknown function (DUF4351)/Putative transposase, YhgA-like